MFLTIITATYNRAYCLPNIYNSLLYNDRQDFEWIIVDDGSIDETEQLVKEWVIEDKINIRYVKQSNGGKTRAVMNGFSQAINGIFAVVLDSDDYLVEGIISSLKAESKNLPDKCIGLVGLKSDLEGRVIGTKFTKPFSSYLEIYFGRKPVQGDKLFFIKSVFYKSSFIQPFYEEKFIPDNIPYIITNKYGYLKCLNKIVYQGEYLADGMTANVVKMAAKNIKGFILEKNMLQSERIALKERLKNEIKYIYYSRGGGMTFAEIFSKSKRKFYTALFYFPVSMFFCSKINELRKLNIR